MRVFVTGASGFIGSAVVAELIGSGHQVTGLARSDASAERVRLAGATALRGDLEDLETLRRGAEAADGIVHTGYIHDFTDFANAALVDKRAIEAMGEALSGSDRPLVVASGVALIAPGRTVTEDDVRGRDGVQLPRASEETAIALAARGVRTSVLRLPPTVHGSGDHGFVPRLIANARDNGEAVYALDGRNRWPAVHRHDAARLFRLALEQAPAGSILHGVGEDGVPMRDIAEVIGRHLRVPAVSKTREEFNERLGWLGMFASLDVPASSVKTRLRFDWEPTHPGLIEDLEQGHYFATEPAHV